MEIIILVLIYLGIAKIIKPKADKFNAKHNIRNSSSGRKVGGSWGDINKHWHNSISSNSGNYQMTARIFTAILLLSISLPSHGNYSRVKVKYGLVVGSPSIYPTRIRKGSGQNSDDYWAEYSFYIVKGQKNTVRVNSKNFANNAHILKHFGLDGNYKCSVVKNKRIEKCHYRLLTKHGGAFNAHSVFLRINRNWIF